MVVVIRSLIPQPLGFPIPFDQESYTPYLLHNTQHWKPRSRSMIVMHLPLLIQAPWCPRDQKSLPRPWHYHSCVLSTAESCPHVYHRQYNLYPKKHAHPHLTLMHNAIFGGIWYGAIDIICTSLQIQAFTVHMNTNSSAVHHHVASCSLFSAWLQVFYIATVGGTDMFKSYLYMLQMWHRCFLTV